MTLAILWWGCLGLWLAAIAWLLIREQIGIWRYRRRVAKRLKAAEWGALSRQRPKEN